MTLAPSQMERRNFETVRRISVQPYHYCKRGGEFHPAGCACRAGGYFFCIPSMYLFRLATRCCTSASCPPLMVQKRLPQIGISLLPWAAV